MLVLIAELDHDQVGTLQQGLRENGVDLRVFVILPEGVPFVAEDCDAAIVGGIIVGNRSGQCHLELSRRDSLCDLLPPVTVDLAHQVDVQSHCC